jgi:Fe-S cluster biogenesis protein NfuA
MFVQTQKTPNPNSLKFIPGRIVSNDGPYEILNKDETKNTLIRNILSINGVTGIFLGEDFLSVNKVEESNWEDIQHIIISYINEYYAEGNKFIIDKSNSSEPNGDFDEIEKKIIHILETKVRPAVAKDGGDIKFKEYKDGKVKVELQGSCSGCPSSTMTLKQGVQNLLSHYIPEVKEVLAV